MSTRKPVLILQLRPEDDAAVSAVDTPWGRTLLRRFVARYAGAP